MKGMDEENENDDNDDNDDNGDEGGVTINTNNKSTTK